MRIMSATRWGILALAATLAAGALLAPAGTGRKGHRVARTPEDFDKLIEGLTAEAEAYAEADSDLTPPVAATVKDLYYHPKAAKQIGEALLPEHESAMTRLYLAYQLMQPLDKAGDKMLLKLKSPLLKLFNLCKYKRMPVWPEYKLQRLIIPNRRMSRPERQRREQAKRKFLEEKRQAERAIAKHNRLVDAMQRTLKILLIRMGDPQADAILLTRLGEEENDQWTTFRTTLAGIQADAIDMNQAQAKRYYDGLLPLFRRSTRKREYYDPTKPQYSSTGNSDFARTKAWFAQETARVINIVATIAREPAIFVPGEKKPGKRKRGR